MGAVQLPERFGRLGLEERRRLLEAQVARGGMGGGER